MHRGREAHEIHLREVFSTFTRHYKLEGRFDRKRYFFAASRMFAARRLLACLEKSWPITAMDCMLFLYDN